ncbi:MAG: serine racemase VanT catalytic subunit [Butyrivibrio sp.]|nr:serine racemase VanT catalytic subunit [Butyrivibrio sp.]
MKTHKNYGRLDQFRLIAAFLVIAIHTSPLTLFGADADFFFTRVLARVAVPFFFMVTGHFTLSALFTPAGNEPNGHDGNKPSENQRPTGSMSGNVRGWDASAGRAIKRCLIKLCLLYGVAVLLYLPLGIYAGHYRELSLRGVLRMLLFDGAFYHLWYFPACILGILIVSLLSRFCSLKGAAVIASFLYIAGLLGDSYFGLAVKIPFLKGAYEAMFRLFSYTRNGLFLAPLFLLLGILAGRIPAAADSRRPTDTGEAEPASALRRKARELLSRPLPLAVCLAVSFAAMTTEAFLLRFFSLQRHDSMYVFLVPVMFFLYRLLLSLPEVPSQKGLRTAALWIYVLHPAFIVVVRGIAKPLHLTAVLVDNSLLHYLTVSLLSAGAGICPVLLSGRLRRRPAESVPGRYRAWLELDMDALAHNVRFLQSRLPADVRLMPAVKANAYGHGAVLIAEELSRLGIHSFCVACLSEGIELRKAGVRGEILILGYTPPERFPKLRRYRLTQAVLDYPYAECLEKSGVRIHVHIAVDTGMHRLGIRCEDMEQIAAVYKMKNLAVDGIFTHLSASDSRKPEDRSFTECQIAAFFQVAELLRAEGCPCRGLHLLSSYGILNYPDACGDYVRPGIALYGVLSRGEDSPGIPADENAETAGPPLRPVLSLKARVSSLRTLHIGESAGYGLSFIADREMRLAVLSIGYGDGLPRALSQGKGRVLIHGHSAPVIGRICMDQTLVDVSRIPRVTQGDTAVLIGVSAAEEITVGELAACCDTITNEILSRLGARLERVCKNSMIDI